MKPLLTIGSRSNGTQPRCHVASVPTAISTEGRVFVAQLTRDIRARERAGANLLSPGATNWREAFDGFGRSLIESAGPIKAAKKFRTALANLKLAQEEK